MSNVKISALPTGTALVDSDTLPVVRAGVTTGVNTGTLVADVATAKTNIATLQAAPTVLSPIQGRLQVDSTSSISLQRYQGKLIPINGVNVSIPSAGVSLSNTGLTAATLYYVYAFLSSGTLTLEAVTTTHATDSTTGVEIKSGDATRTLVGMVYMGAGTPGTFVDSVTSRTCISWANRRSLDMANAFSTSRTSASNPSWAEINSEIQLVFLTWATEAVSFFVTGTASNNTAGQATGTAIAVDSTSTPLAVNGHTNPSGQGSLRGNIALSYVARLSEGNHFATLLALVSGGTATWVSADTIASDGAAKTRFWGRVQG